MSSPRQLLGNAHYRRLFVARSISNLGNGIAPIALAFGVLGLPGATPTSLSIVLAAQAVPLIVMLPIGGVVADRLGRARVIAVTDIVLSAVVMTTAVLFLTGTATVPLLALLGFLSGILNGLWYPAFPGLVPDVVKQEEHLQPANAYVGDRLERRPDPRQRGGRRAGGGLRLGRGHRHRLPDVPHCGCPRVHVPPRVEAARVGRDRAWATSCTAGGCSSRSAGSW